MPKLTRMGPTQITVDFSDMSEVDASKVIDEYLQRDQESMSVYELHRVLVEGILFEIRHEQASFDDAYCDTVIGDLPCGNVAEFEMEDGVKICFECYRIYSQRYGSNTGKSLKEIS